MPTSATNGGVATKPRHTVKSFEVAARATLPEADREPLAFDLVYRDTDGNEHHSREWHARPWLIPDLLLMRLPNMAITMESLDLFRAFRMALGDEYREFDEFVNSPDVFVDAKAFLPILEWFVEEGAGRPTQPS